MLNWRKQLAPVMITFPYDHTNTEKPSSAHIMGLLAWLAGVTGHHIDKRVRAFRTLEDGKTDEVTELPALSSMIKSGKCFSWRYEEHTLGEMNQWRGECM